MSPPNMLRLRQALALAVMVSCTTPRGLTVTGRQGPNRGAPRAQAVSPARETELPQTRPPGAAAGVCGLSAPATEVELAAVGEVVLTGCDVYVAWARETRVGRHDDDPRSVFSRVLRDALLAAEAVRVGLTDGDRRAVDRVLAEGLVRREALESLPRGAEAEAETEANPGPAETALRLRALVFRTRAEATLALGALEGGAAWDDYLARSIDPLAARDQGDLGVVTASRHEGLDEAVFQAAAALTEVGAFVPRVMAVRQTVTVTVRRRPRSRVMVGFWVVQLTGRGAPEAAPPRSPRRGGRERYLTARSEARNRWHARLEAQVRAAIDDAALGAVNIAPGGQSVDRPGAP
ncbi:MAG: hypothetical protein JNK72_19675 [Myxococcales bacterium]|nr:hypothetical protein [Myxococcales bacterium]